MSAQEPFLATPRYLSDVPEGTDISAAQIGADALQLGFMPQGEMVAQVMQAQREDGKPLYNKVVVQFARRSQKTTCIQLMLLGRCFTIPGYRIVQTAQTQNIASRVFRDMQIALEAAYPDEATRPFTAGRSNGKEQIRWDNGSVWFIVAPKAAAMRSQAADVIWFDEAGEYSLEQTQDLVEGALPLMDTRPNGQVIISGTPAKTRGGMLWEYLTKARDGKARHGIVDFSMDPADDPTDEAVWWRVHPGLASGLTDIDTIRERFEGMPLQSFQREYLCADPVNATIAAIPEEDWMATTVPDFLEVPEGASLGYATTPDGTAGAIAAAWYDADGRPHVQLLEHREGISWMPAKIAESMRAAPRSSVQFDRVSNNLAVWQELQRKRNLPMSNLNPVGMKEYAAGVSTLMSSITDRALVHAQDKSLDAAAEGASFRYVQDSRLFNRRTANVDISPLEAVSVALYHASGKRQSVKYSPKAVTF